MQAFQKAVQGRKKNKKFFSRVYIKPSKLITQLITYQHNDPKSCVKYKHLTFHMENNTQKAAVWLKAFEMTT